MSKSALACPGLPWLALACTGPEVPPPLPLRGARVHARLGWRGKCGARARIRVGCAAPAVCASPARASRGAVRRGGGPTKQGGAGVPGRARNSWSRAYLCALMFFTPPRTRRRVSSLGVPWPVPERRRRARSPAWRPTRSGGAGAPIATRPRAQGGSMRVDTLRRPAPAVTPASPLRHPCVKTAARDGVTPASPLRRDGAPPRHPCVTPADGWCSGDTAALLGVEHGLSCHFIFLHPTTGLTTPKWSHTNFGRCAAAILLLFTPMMHCQTLHGRVRSIHV
jgi:hypothetical protein